MHHGFITPAPLHYVRNHGAVPRGDWSIWTVEVTGLVRRPARLTMDELANGFPAAEVPATLVCAGNPRKEQNMMQQTAGFNLGAAGVSTSVWRGVRLRDVLLRCGIMSRKGQALNVCFEGAEDLPGGGGSKYSTSVSREWALDASSDILLAYAQNGEPLLADHGFSVGVLIPGCIGGRMVKWLWRIVVTPAASPTTTTTSRTTGCCRRTSTRSSPTRRRGGTGPSTSSTSSTHQLGDHHAGHDEILPINAFTTQRAYTMKGYAYSARPTDGEGGEEWRIHLLSMALVPSAAAAYG